jgi:hypothetical protein
MSYMNKLLRIPLNTTSAQHERLMALQKVFAQVCNQLAPEVSRTKVWNRVALHHLHYRSLRVQYPTLGSQMVCNAIYAVSRTARLVFQSPASPFNVQKMGERPLPALRFADTCPVYFDRHTLSLKVGKLSLFTLDGRMQFELTLGQEKLALFETGKLREVVLSRGADDVFVLSFWLESDEALANDIDSPESQEADVLPAPAEQGPLIPDYVSVEVN